MVGSKAQGIKKLERHSATGDIQNLLRYNLANFGYRGYVIGNNKIFYPLYKLFIIILNIISI